MRKTTALIGSDPLGSSSGHANGYGSDNDNKVGNGNGIVVGSRNASCSGNEDESDEGDGNKCDPGNGSSNGEDRDIELRVSVKQKVLVNRHEAAHKSATHKSACPIVGLFGLFG